MQQPTNSFTACKKKHGMKKTYKSTSSSSLTALCDAKKMNETHIVKKKKLTYVLEIGNHHLNPALV